VTHVVGPSPAFPCNPASASTRGRARHRGGGRPLAARADRRAKRSGLPFALYDEADNRSDPWRLALIAGLRRGRRRRELVLHYQPKPRLAAWIRPLTRYVLEEAVRRARDRQLAGLEITETTMLSDGALPHPPRAGGRAGSPAGRARARPGGLTPPTGA